MSTVEDKELEAYKREIDLLFYATRNAGFNIPRFYMIPLMKGLVTFAMEQLHHGTQEDTDIIYAAYEKWTGEPYESSEDEDED